MAIEPRRTPAEPGASIEPVQPVEEASPVPHDWLADPEHAERAEAVDRLAVDVEMNLSLGLAGYEGPDWEYFSNEVVKYGLGVLIGWMRRGIILAKCRERGIGLPAFSRALEAEEIEELAGETVAKALQHFRTDVLMRGKWDHRRGASLRTYFMGQCLLRFANIYRAWWNHETHQQHLALTDDLQVLDLLGRESAHAGPESQTPEWLEAMTALRGVRDQRVVRAMILTAAGRSQAEIADQLGETEKTVERMLGNERNRQRARRAG